MEKDRHNVASVNPPTIFFIVSAPRSGSTMLADICDSGSNCTCEIEPLTKLVQEYPHELIEAIYKRSLKCTTPIYGQKDPSYYKHITWLYEAFNCKFIHLIRDREQVAQSIYNWQKFFTDGIWADSIQDARELWVRYNAKIVEQLIEVPKENHVRVELKLGLGLIDIINALKFLDIHYNNETVIRLFNSRINSPEQRDFV